jgi:hypothetical protein
MGSPVWTAVVMPAGAWPDWRCGGAGAARPVTWEPDSPNELSARPTTRPALAVPRGVAKPASTAISLFGGTAIGLFGGQDPQRMYPLLAFRERSRTHTRAKPCLAATTYNARTHNLCIGSSRFETIPNARMGEALFGRDDLQRCIGPRASKTIADPRMGEALFGGPTHDARTNATSRDEHLAWPPVWDGAS